MVLETFTLVQEYVAAVVLLIAAILWYKVKTRENIDVLKSNRLFNISLILALPFIVKLMKFIPDDINLLIQHVLIFLVLLALLVVSVRLSRHNARERRQGL